MVLILIFSSQATLNNIFLALALDEQNDRLHNLEKSINTMAAGTFIPDVVKLNRSAELQSGPSQTAVNSSGLYIGLATGENIIRVKLNECTLLAFRQEIPRIFCLVEFYHLKPQTTGVKQGKDINQYIAAIY